MSITPDERRMIDAAIAEGRVTACAPGASGLWLDQVWCPRARRLVARDLVHLDPGQRARAHRARYAAKKRGPQPSAAVLERRSRLLDLHNSGMTGAEIRAEMGIPVHTLYADAKRLGIRVRLEKSRPASEHADRIRELEDQLATVLQREAETHARHDAKVDALEAKLEKWQACQQYSYIGRDGKTVLARDLEDRAEAAEAKLAKAREALSLAANRLQSCAIDLTPNSREFFRASEWAEEARTTLKEIDNG